MSDLVTREATIMQYEFPRAVEMKVRIAHPELSDEEYRLIEVGLRQWFVCCLYREPKTAIAMPSLAVDWTWHEFILCTRQYIKFCDEVMGGYIHHTPAPMMEAGEDEGGAERCQVAWAKSQWAEAARAVGEEIPMELYDADYYIIEDHQRIHARYRAEAGLDALLAGPLAETSALSQLAAVKQSLLDGEYDDVFVPEDDTI